MGRSPYLGFYEFITVKRDRLPSIARHDPKVRRLDITLAKMLFKWEPKVELEEALEKDNSVLSRSFKTGGVNSLIKFCTPSMVETLDPSLTHTVLSNVNSELLNQSV